MPNQPLTDAINALTTYSNTVTGASDTDLSAAVATLAAGYGGGSIDLSGISSAISQNTIGGMFKAIQDGTWGSIELTVTSGTNPIQINFGRPIKGYICYPKSITILSGLIGESTGLGVAIFNDADSGGSQTHLLAFTRYKTGGNNQNYLFHRCSAYTMVNGLVSLTPQYPANASYNPFQFGEPYIFVYWWE